MPSNNVSSWTLICITVACSFSLVSGTPNRQARQSGDFRLTILHNNDMHGRFEETARNTGSCPEQKRSKTCIGGFARTAQAIRNFRDLEKNGGPSVLYLNAGDTFVGTAWFSVFTWNITAACMNLLKPDAVSLGNHEFDLTPRILEKYLDHLDAPVLAANLGFSKEAGLLGKVNKSIVLTVAGRKVGIIGYLTPETILISSVGNVTFEPEVGAIKKEAQLLQNQGVNIIIALGHSGYEMDKTIAFEVPQVDLVVGGHTNTFLWNGDQPDYEKIEDLYPKVITQQSGKRVPVVQAYAYTKYLGVLNCTFNSNGDLATFAGQPFLMDSERTQAQDVVQLLEIYRPEIEALNKEIIGVSRVFLDGRDYNCRFKECNLGNLVADALVSYAFTESITIRTNVSIGIYNGGGLRNSITPHPETGEITRGDLISVLPFNNQVIVLTLKGSDLKEALEQMVRSNGETSRGEFPQVSGLKLILDKKMKPFSRVVSLKALCGHCKVPTYHTVQPDEKYSLVTSSFLADGGDGITVFRDKSLDRKILDLVDLDAVAMYIEKHSPIHPEVGGRIIIVGENYSSGSRLSLSSSVVVVALVSFLWKIVKKCSVV